MTPAGPSVLWELTGRTGKPLSCSIEQAGSSYQLRVTMGEHELVTDSFQTEQDALTHADFLRRDFVAEGWLEVFSRDPHF
jgi:hypothetical protein